MRAPCPQDAIDKPLTQEARAQFSPSFDKQTATARLGDDRHDFGKRQASRLVLRYRLHFSPRLAQGNRRCRVAILAAEYGDSNLRRSFEHPRIGRRPQIGIKDKPVRAVSLETRRPAGEFGIIGKHSANGRQQPVAAAALQMNIAPHDRPGDPALGAVPESDHPV